MHTSSDAFGKSSSTEHRVTSQPLPCDMAFQCCSSSGRENLQDLLLSVQSEGRRGDRYRGKRVETGFGP